MKKFCILTIILTISTILAANFLNKYEPEVIDARASALGGCSILASQGANYLFNNSAELAKLSTSNIQISFKQSSGEYNSRYNNYDSLLVMKNKGKYNSNIRLNGLAIAKQLELSNNIGSAVAIGWRRYFDMASDYTTELTFYDFGNESVISEDKISQDGGFGTLVLGGGISLTENIRLGITYSSPMFNKNSYQERDLLEERSTLMKSYEITYEGSFLTYSGTFEVRNLLSIAFRYHNLYKFREKIKGTRISESSGHEYSYNKTTKYSIPSELALSTKLTPFKNLALYGEYVSRNLHMFESEGHPFYGETDPGYAFKTGIEYGSKLKLRFGYFSRSNPYYKRIEDNDKAENNRFNEYYQNNHIEEYGLSAGAGIKLFNKINIDFFASLSKLKYSEKMYNWYLYQNCDVKRKYEINRFGTSLGYSF